MQWQTCSNPMRRNQVVPKTELEVLAIPELQRT